MPVFFKEQTLVFYSKSLMKIISLNFTRILYYILKKVPTPFKSFGVGNTTFFIKFGVGFGVGYIIRGGIWGGEPTAKSPQALTSVRKSHFLIKENGYEEIFANNYSFSPSTLLIF